MSGGVIQKLIPSNNEFSYSICYYPAMRSRSYQGCVYFQGIGGYIISNEIAYGPDMAIYGTVAWGYLFYGNYIHEFLYDKVESGVWYMWAAGYYPMWDNVISHNIFANNPYLKCIYLDGSLSGVSIVWNKFVLCSGCVYINGGRSVVVAYNYFEQCTYYCISMAGKYV